MGHHYKLYEDVQAECLCCHRMESFNFKSRSDQVVCPACRRHPGDSPERLKVREAQHTKWWVEEYQRWKEHYTATVSAAEARRLKEVAALDQQVTALREQLSDFQGAMLRGLDSRPVETVARWFEQTKIAEANEDTKRARTFIKHLFHVLWRIDLAHQVDDEDDDRCSCGERIDRCPTYDALTPVRGKLHGWEVEEIERLKVGLPHSLPGDHPEVRRREPWRVVQGA